MPFELPSHRALAFGDTVLEIDGELRVWETIVSDGRRTRYEQRFLPTLGADNARRRPRPRHPRRAGAGERRPALAASATRPPWHRSSLK
jgi:hypothetical protein